MEGTLKCARCEYDLRMHDVYGVCPECALPVADSVAAAARYRLLDIGPLRWAVLVLVVAAVMRMIFAVALLTWHFAQGRGTQTRPDLLMIVFNLWPIEDIATTLNGPVWRMGPWIVSLLVWWLAVFFVHLSGIWLITSRRVLNRAWHLRLATRWLPIVTIVLMIDAMMLRWSASIFFSDWPGRMVAVLFVGIPPALLLLWTAIVMGATGLSSWAIRLGWVAASCCMVVAVATEFRRPWFEVPGAVCAFIAFGVTTWMWITLWRATRVKMD